MRKDNNRNPGEQRKRTVMEGDSRSYRLYRTTCWDACLKIHADQGRKCQYLSTSDSTRSANASNIILYMSSSQYPSTTDVLTVDAEAQKISP